MNTEHLHKVRPETVSAFINFNFNGQWSYDRDEKISVPKIQAEGAAKLWNLLLDKNIALLADEVGMGKTIQALAVMSILWRQKPGAKVLLYAPNFNVAQKWMREYDNFIRYNYRDHDNLVKSSIQGHPMRGCIFCENHLQLLQEVNRKWPSFFICKTSSLSGFLSPKITQHVLDHLGLKIKKNVDELSSDQEKAIWMANFGEKSNSFIYDSLSNQGEPPFDLLIFDEAHYLRRTDMGDNILASSNRSIAANAFFSGRNIESAAGIRNFQPLAKKVLLMTATPNHSGSDDIKNIISLFRPEYQNKQPFEILNEICVRRFRRLAGKTKHEYRQEIATGVEMQSLKERLFFAAYHKSLVKLKAEEAEQLESSRNRDNPYKILFGYLEGFEFLPENQEKISKSQKQQEGTDFHQREDSKVIEKLSKIYKQIYRERPEHPKYREMISSLKPKGNQEPVNKKLVFVRRINSVYEISNRLIESYDDLFWNIMEYSFPKKVHKSLLNNPRKYFWELSKSDEQINEELQISTDKEIDQTDAKLKDSRYLSLFTIKREGKFRTTDCSNFRNRFLKKDQLFSVFFEPPSDYKSKSYNLSGKYLHKQGKRLYKTSIQKLRIDQLPRDEISRSLLTERFQLEDNYEEKHVEKRSNFKTIFTIWISFQPENAGLKELMTEAIEIYKNDFTLFEKEGFSQYLEAGILFASSHLVWFYSIYRTLIAENKGIKGEDLYTEFCNSVQASMEESGLAHLISTAVISFQTYYKKELGYSKDDIYRQDWSFLKNVVPVYPYCGSTKRETILKAFNSPFYPDVLVATSVLQEGVDLHYHCSEVIHYGIAWTQGDNEQRVGRVDRMFGKMEKQLVRSPEAILPIHYPYLRKTIDQDQVARFILRKHESEKLLDQLKHVEFKNDVNWREQVPETVWSELLNTPQKVVVDADPFPVIYERDFAGIVNESELNSVSIQLKEYLDSLIGSLRSHFGNDLIVHKSQDGHGEGAFLFTLNHIRKDKSRHQPIMGELYISEEGLFIMEKPVFCFRISTPLARNYRNFENINRFRIMKEQYKNNPLLKICHDKETRGYFRFYVRTDLPLFITEKNQLNLSEEEVVHCIHTLIQFSDDLEEQLHDHKQDVSYTDLWGSPEEKSDPTNMGAMRKNSGRESNNRWTKNQTEEHVYLESNLEVFDDREAYVYNHNNQFLKAYKTDNIFKCQAGIYLNDALGEEMTLLEKVFDAKP